MSRKVTIVLENHPERMEQLLPVAETLKLPLHRFEIATVRLIPK